MTVLRLDIPLRRSHQGAHPLLDGEPTNGCQFRENVAFCGREMCWHHFGDLRLYSGHLNGDRMMALHENEGTCDVARWPR